MPKLKSKHILWVEDDQQLVDMYTAMFTKIKNIKVANRLENKIKKILRLCRIKNNPKASMGGNNLA